MIGLKSIGRRGRTRSGCGRSFAIASASSSEFSHWRGALAVGGVTIHIVQVARLLWPPFTSSRRLLRHVHQAATF
jgi:hypothetical protein